MVLGPHCIQYLEVSSSSDDSTQSYLPAVPGDTMGALYPIADRPSTRLTAKAPEFVPRSGWQTTPHTQRIAHSVFERIRSPPASLATPAASRLRSSELPMGEWQEYHASTPAYDEDRQADDEGSEVDSLRSFFFVPRQARVAAVEIEETGRSSIEGVNENRRVIDRDIALVGAALVP